MTKEDFVKELNKKSFSMLDWLMVQTVAAQMAQMTIEGKGEVDVIAFFETLPKEYDCVKLYFRLYSEIEEYCPEMYEMVSASAEYVLTNLGSFIDNVTGD